MINNTVLTSGVQQSDSLIHIHASILFHDYMAFRGLKQRWRRKWIRRDLGGCGHRVVTSVPSNWHRGAGDCKALLAPLWATRLVGAGRKCQGASGGERQGPELPCQVASHVGGKLAPGQPVAAVRPGSPRSWVSSNLGSSLPQISFLVTPAADFALPPDGTLSNTLQQLKVTGVPSVSSSHVEQLKGSPASQGWEWCPKAGRSWQTPLESFESAPVVNKLHRFWNSPQGSKNKLFEGLLYTFLKTHSLRIATFPLAYHEFPLKKKFTSVIPNWRTVILRSSCPVANVLGPTSDFPTWQSGKETRNSQGFWLWMLVGFDYRNSTGLRETETLGGHKQNCVCRRTQRKRAGTLQEIEPDLPMRVWGSEWRPGSAVAYCGDRGAGSSSPGRLWHKSILEVTGLNCLQIPGLNCLRSVNEQAGSIVPPISRQLDYRFKEHDSAHQSKTQFSPQPIPPIRKQEL